MRTRSSPRSSVCRGLGDQARRRRRAFKSIASFGCMNRRSDFRIRCGVRYQRAPDVKPPGRASVRMLLRVAEDDESCVAAKAGARQRLVHRAVSVCPPDYPPRSCQYGTEAQVKNVAVICATGRYLVLRRHFLAGSGARSATPCRFPRAVGAVGVENTSASMEPDGGTPSGSGYSMRQPDILQVVRMHFAPAANPGISNVPSKIVCTAGPDGI